MWQRVYDNGWCNEPLQENRTLIRRKVTIYKHTKGNTLYLTIPSSVAGDSAFPFKRGDQVIIEVKGNKLEVRKA